MGETASKSSIYGETERLKYLNQKKGIKMNALITQQKKLRKWHNNLKKKKGKRKEEIEKSL